MLCTVLSMMIHHLIGFGLFLGLAFAGKEEYVPWGRKIGIFKANRMKKPVVFLKKTDPTYYKGYIQSNYVIYRPDLHEKERPEYRLEKEVNADVMKALNGKQILQCCKYRGSLLLSAIDPNVKAVQFPKSFLSVEERMREVHVLKDPGHCFTANVAECTPEDVQSVEWRLQVLEKLKAMNLNSTNRLFTQLAYLKNLKLKNRFFIRPNPQVEADAMCNVLHYRIDGQQKNHCLGFIWELLHNHLGERNFKYESGDIEDAVKH